MAAETHKHFLLFLTEATPAQFKFLLNTASQRQLTAIREVVVNVLENIIPLSDTDKSQLATHEAFYTRLANKLIPRPTLVRHTKALSKLLNIAHDAIQAL